MEVRPGANPADVKNYDTDRLRHDFLIQNLFVADEIKTIYSQIDRIIVGAATPVNKELVLEAGAELRAKYFLERREMGIINIGGNGTVTVDGKEYNFKYKYCWVCLMCWCTVKIELSRVLRVFTLE